MIWIEWVEPFVESDPVYLRVSRETAIKYAKDGAAKHGHTYATDEDALMDFIIVNWARETPDDGTKTA